MRLVELFLHEQDWQSVIDDAETPEQVANAIKASGAMRVDFPSTKMPPIYVTDDEVIEWDGETAYASVTDKAQWLWDADVEDYFPNHQDEFNTEFWRRPRPLYHETTAEFAETIAREGLKPMDKTRGMSNRGVGNAVFTTANQEGMAGHYGDHVFMIDTAAMARAGLRPYVAQEPPVVMAELRNGLAHKIEAGEDFYAETDNDMDPDTVIVYGAIPPQYLRKLR